jgi:hypothetical protein
MSAARRSKLDPPIERIRLDKLTIFEITEAELDALERGSTESLFFNLAIATVSIATSFLVSLLTTVIENDRTLIVFVVICVVGFLSGLTFTLLWLQMRKSLKKVAREIRDRKPPEGKLGPSTDPSP